MSKKFNNVDSIIFDLDGTLWDSRKEVASAWTEVIRTYNYERKEVTFQEVNDLMGKTIDEIDYFQSYQKRREQKSYTNAVKMKFHIYQNMEQNYLII